VAGALSLGLKLALREAYYLRKAREKCIRFEVFTAVTMKNVAFWDIKTQFVPYRRHITFPLQSSAS
jgi:hypothetical protein